MEPHPLHDGGEGGNRPPDARRPPAEPRPGGRFRGIWPRPAPEERPALRRELTQHVLQDAAVAEVFELVEGIDAADERHLLDLAVRRGDLGGEPLSRLQLAGDAAQRDRLVALEAERGPRGLADEDERHHAHADEVRAVDALEALGDDGPDAEEVRALGGPIARRAGAVLLAGED